MPHRRLAALFWCPGQLLTIHDVRMVSCGLRAGLISATAATGAGSSYGALVRRTIGPKAEATLQFAVLANCYIMEVVFVVVLGDILVGTAPDYGGLLPEWTGYSPADCFWLRRDVVLGAVSLLVLLPLAAMRSMERLAVVNIIGG
jgi:amino acid permease